MQNKVLYKDTEDEAYVNLVNICLHSYQIDQGFNTIFILTYFINMLI